MGGTLDDGGMASSTHSATRKARVRYGSAALTLAAKSPHGSSIRVLQHIYFLHKMIALFSTLCCACADWNSFKLM